MKVRNFSTVGGAGGSSDFLGLVDTPETYVAGQLLAVNDTADGVEFYSRQLVYNFWAGGLVIYDDELLGQVVLPEAMVLKAGAVGAYAYANVAPTASATLNLLKNDVSIGTVVFSAASNTGVVSIPTDTSFVSSDRLSISYSGAPDSTIADITVSLRGDLV